MSVHSDLYISIFALRSMVQSLLVDNRDSILITGLLMSVLSEWQFPSVFVRPTWFSHILRQFQVLNFLFYFHFRFSKTRDNFAFKVFLWNSVGESVGRSVAPSFCCCSAYQAENQFRLPQYTQSMISTTKLVIWVHISI